MLVNVGLIFGRIIFNVLVDWFGCLNFMFVCMLGSVIFVFGWLGVKNFVGLVVFVLLYGVFLGGVVSLIFSVVVELFFDFLRVGIRMGFGFIVFGIVVLIGMFIVGVVLGGESVNVRWVLMVLYVVCGFLIVMFFYLIVRFL